MADFVNVALRLFPAPEFGSARTVTRPSSIFRHSGTSSFLAEKAKKESCMMGEKVPDCNKGDSYIHIEVSSSGKVRGSSHEPASNAHYPGDEVNLFWNQYMAVEEPSVSQDLSIITCKAYRDSSEADLDWSSEDQKRVPTSNIVAVGELKDGKGENEDDPTESGGLEDTAMAKQDLFMADSVLSRSSAENHSSVGLSNMSSEREGNRTDTKGSSHKDVLQDAIDNNRDRAPLTSHRYYAYFENCDLPPSQKIFSWKGPLKKLEPQGSLSGDKLLLEALIRLNEPTSVGMDCLPELLGTSDPTPFFDYPPSISQPLAIPCAFPQLSTVNRVGSQSAEQGGVSKRAYETLGQALCHSQTRARKAEKVAAQALDERERMAKMLFREAWIARTYKQWVQVLEFENMWLRACWDDDLKSAMAKKGHHSSDVCAFEEGTGDGLKKQLVGKKVLRGWVSDKNLFMGYTIGLAFALGLSFAGASFVIGWRMGWISLAC